MRWTVPLILLAALAPLATAQTPDPTAAARPSLSVDPPSYDAAPSTVRNVTAIFANPTATAIAFALSFQAPPEVRLNYERWEVVVPAQGRAHVNATIKVPDLPNVTHDVTLLAQEKAASAQNAGRAEPIKLQATLEARVGPAKPAATATKPTPPIEIVVDPSAISLAEGGEARALITVRNRGPEIPDATFESSAMKGVTITFEGAPARIPANASVELTMILEHSPDAPNAVEAGMTLEPAIGLRGYGTKPFRVEIVPPAEPATDDALAAEIAAPNAAAASLEQRIVVAAALGSVGAAWTTLWLSRHKWLPLLAALYTRLRPSKLLDHPLRKRIVDLVQKEPGITFGDLARRLGIAPGQLTHHARMLEKAGIVFSSPDGQTRRFFHVGHGRLDAVPPLAERALAAVRAKPMRASDLAKELGVSRQALHYHVKKLVAEGKLVAMSEGGETILAAPPSSAAAA